MKFFGGKDKVQALEDMTDQELMDAWSAEVAVFEARKKRLKAFSAEHDRRLVAEQARKVFNGLSDSEKAALAQVMHAEGIESQERVNE